MLLSTAMMSEWLGSRHRLEAFVEAGTALDTAVERAFADHAARPLDLGGSSTTADIVRAMIERIGATGAPT